MRRATKADHSLKTAIAWFAAASLLMIAALSAPATAGAVRGRIEIAGREDHGGVFVWVDLANVAKTDAGGAYELSGLADGTYIVRAWAERCLARIVDTVTVAGGDVEASALTLLAIDLHEDGRINLQDYGAIMERYGSTGDSPDWDPDFDLTRDGVIDSLDAQGLLPHWHESADFSPPSFEIELNEPSAGTVWPLGRENVAIRWYTGHVGGTVSIELLRDGAPVETIVASTPNDGEYLDYDVPASLVPENDYSIRVSLGEGDRDESDRFGVHRLMAVTEPSASTVWYGRQMNVSVRWDDCGLGGTADITLCYEGTPIDTIALDTPNDGALDGYDVSSRISPVNAKYRVCVRVDEAQYGCSEEFTLNSSGRFTVYYPNYDTIWYTNQPNVSIYWGHEWIPGSAFIALYREEVCVDTITLSTANSGKYYLYDVSADLEPGSGYQVFVRHLTSGDCGFSDPFTIIDGDTTINVTEPTAATLWSPGQRNVYIRWLPNPLVGLVTIELYRGDARVRVIIYPTPNDGEFIWTVPNDVPPASDYRVRVFFDDRHVDFSEAFEIRQILVVEEPRDTTVWIAGRENVPIRWATGGLGGSVSIALMQGSRVAATIASETPNDGSHDDFDVDPWMSAGRYAVRIRHESGVFDLSDEFTIRQWAITVTEPVAGAEWAPNHAVPPIRWSTEYPVDSVSIELVKGGTPVLSIADATPNDGSFEGFVVPASGLEGGPDYRVRVSYRHSGYPVRSGYSGTFTVLPSVTVTEPTAASMWERGREIPPIRWRTGGLGGTVTITLYRGSMPVEQIAFSTANDGSYEGYVVPQGLSEGSNYRVLVTFDVDRYDFSEYFLIR